MSAQTLRPYQARTVAYLMDEWLPASKPGARLLVTAPTGTGKGTVQLALVRPLQARGWNPLILTASLHVVRGVVATPDAGRRVPPPPRPGPRRPPGKPRTGPSWSVSTPSGLKPC